MIPLTPSDGLTTKGNYSLAARVVATSIAC